MLSWLILITGSNFKPSFKKNQWVQLPFDGSKWTHWPTLTTALEGLAKQAHCHWASIQRQGLFINGGGGAGKRCGGGAQAGGEALVLGMTCFSKSNISCRVWRSVSHPTWGHNSPLENDRQNVVIVTFQILHTYYMGPKSRQSRPNMEKICRIRIWFYKLRTYFWVESALQKRNKYFIIDFGFVYIYG